MTLEEKQAWEKIRGKGQPRYVLRLVLSAGIGFALLIALIDFVPDAYFGHPYDAWKIAITFLYMIIALGGGLGILKWRTNEKSYHAPTEVNEPG